MKKVYPKIILILQVLGMLFLFYRSYTASFFINFRVLFTFLIIYLGVEFPFSVTYYFTLFILNRKKKTDKNFNASSVALHTVLDTSSIINMPVWWEVLVAPWIIGFFYAPFLHYKISAFSGVIAICLLLVFLGIRLYVFFDHLKNIHIQLYFSLFLIHVLRLVSSMLIIYLVGVYVLSKSALAVIIGYWAFTAIYTKLDSKKVT